MLTPLTFRCLTEKEYLDHLQLIADSWGDKRSGESLMAISEWFATMAEPTTTLPQAVDTLPEITFGRDGFSQLLKDAKGDYFYIARRTNSKDKPYLLVDVNGRVASIRMSFAGIILLAAQRVAGRSEPEPLNADNITPDDRRTNYGAF